MRKAASVGDAALSQRDRRRALHVVPTDIYKSAWPYKSRLQTEWSSSMMTESIRGKSLIRERLASAPAPDPPSPHSPRLIVPSPIRTIIGESLRVGELVGKVSHHRPALHGQRPRLKRFSWQSRRWAVGASLIGSHWTPKGHSRGTRDYLSEPPAISDDGKVILNN